MGKPTVCIDENKGADQLRHSDSTIPLLLKTFSVTVQVGVGPVRKPHCWFSHETAYFTYAI